MTDRTHSAQEEGPSQASAELRLLPPTQFGEAPVIYSNYVQATASPHDLTIHFSWYSTPILSEPPTGPVEAPVRGPLTSVTIPLNLVRGVIRVLEAQAASWEASTGQQLPRTEPLSEPPEEQQ